MPESREAHGFCPTARAARRTLSLRSTSPQALLRARDGRHRRAVAAARARAGGAAGAPPAAARRLEPADRCGFCPAPLRGAPLTTLPQAASSPRRASSPLPHTACCAQRRHRRRAHRCSPSSPPRSRRTRAACCRICSTPTLWPSAEQAQSRRSARSMPTTRPRCCLRRHAAPALHRAQRYSRCMPRPSPSRCRSRGASRCPTKPHRQRRLHSRHSARSCARARRRDISPCAGASLPLLWALTRVSLLLCWSWLSS